MLPQQHVCNGLARPADECMLARYNGTDIGTESQTRWKHNSLRCYLFIDLLWKLYTKYRRKYKKVETNAIYGSPLHAQHSTRHIRKHKCSYSGRSLQRHKTDCVLCVRSAAWRHHDDNDDDDDDVWHRGVTDTDELRQFKTLPRRSLLVPTCTGLDVWPASCELTLRNRIRSLHMSCLSLIAVVYTFILYVQQTFTERHSSALFSQIRLLSFSSCCVLYLHNSSKVCAVSIIFCKL